MGGDWRLPRTLLLLVATTFAVLVELSGIHLELFLRMVYLYETARVRCRLQRPAAVVVSLRMTFLVQQIMVDTMVGRLRVLMSCSDREENSSVT